MSSARPIALDEWAAYVRSDPEMRLDGAAEATTTTGETLRVDRPGLAVWVAYSRAGVGGNQAWFDCAADHIVVKSPDEEIIAKMRSIARHLGARVQGDDGEYYDEADCGAD